MNLYENPNIRLTHYIDSVEYFEQQQKLEIGFNCGPENWKPSHKLVFSDVTFFSKEIIDDEDQPGVNNFTDLVIGFDSTQAGYVLHLTTVEFTFTSSATPRFVDAE